MKLIIVGDTHIAQYVLRIYYKNAEYAMDINTTLGICKEYGIRFELLQ